MEGNKRHWQWALSVVIYHGPGFGHCVDIIEHLKAREPKTSLAGQWNSLGVPEPVLTSLRTSIDARITEHLVARYGVQGELPTLWAGEPDPF